MFARIDYVVNAATMSEATLLCNMCFIQHVRTCAATSHVAHAQVKQPSCVLTQDLCRRTDGKNQRLRRFLGAWWELRVKQLSILVLSWIVQIRL